MGCVASFDKGHSAYLPTAPFMQIEHTDRSKIATNKLDCSVEKRNGENQALNSPHTLMNSSLK